MTHRGAHTQCDTNRGAAARCAELDHPWAPHLIVVRRLYPSLIRQQPISVVMPMPKPKPMPSHTRVVTGNTLLRETLVGRGYERIVLIKHTRANTWVVRVFYGHNTRKWLVTCGGAYADKDVIERCVLFEEARQLAHKHALDKSRNM